MFSNGDIIFFVIVGGYFSLCTVRAIFLHLWDQSMALAAEGEVTLEQHEYLCGITPFETPLLKRLKDTNG